MNGEEIRNRFERLRSQRRTIETTWDIIERFCAPYRGEMFRDQQSEHEIDWRRREVYETTAIMAVQNLAASIHGGMTNPKIQWFALRFRNKDLNAAGPAAVWLEEVAEIIHHALQESDFDLEINEAYIDLTSFGTSILIEEVINEDIWEGIDFTAVPVKECFFEMDHKGRVLKFYRRLMWSPVQILDKFGDKTPEDIKVKAGNAAGIDQSEELIFCIYPRKEKQNAAPGSILAPKERPYSAKYIRHKDATQIGDESGYYDMPAFVTRWRKTSESQWGNSPSFIALADILTLNQLVELDLRSREKVIDPPTLTTERGLLGDLDLEPAGLTVVRSLDDIKAYDSGAKFDAVNDTMLRLREQIKEVYFLDKLDLKESPEMTATEVLERTERMHRLLGPTVGRLQSDLLDPLVERTFNILLRNGQLPEPPEELGEGAADLDIEYLGPLARAQKTDTVQAIERFIGGAAQMVEIAPEVFDLIDMDQVVKESHKALSIPKTILRSQKEVDEIRVAKAKAAQAQQQMMQAQQGGEAMKSVGEGAAAMEEGGVDAGGGAPDLEAIEGGLA